MGFAFGSDAIVCQCEPVARRFWMLKPQRRSWTGTGLVVMDSPAVAGVGFHERMTSDYKLIFDLAGTSYPVHANSDCSHMVICRGRR